ncbi:MAG TPA: LamG-like jellyroll fold domain-containing protein [Planctomycetota bacterium]|nr:LamG-like jellyroll fold domain-containing protein [Planctomycetota bacterium]
MPSVDHHRALVRGFVDGTLSADEHAAFEILLRDADVARHLLRELHFDQAIRVAARSQERRAELEAAPHSPATGRLRIRRTPRWRPTLNQWSWLRAAAVVLILALPAWLALTMTVTRMSTAELMVHLGTVDVGGEVRNGASGISNDQELLVSPRGWASVRLYDGTLIELSGGTRVALRSNDDGVRVLLTNGSVQADVRKQPVGKPLVIESSRSRVTVVGTRFAFATAADSDCLEVSEGLVRCARRRDGDSIDVPAGKAVAITSEGVLALQPITPPANAIPEPPASGLTLWFDPTRGITRDERGRVERWNDRAGRGWTVANTKPAQRPSLDLDGRPAIRFAPRGEMLTGSVPWPATGAFTVAIALRPTQLGRWSQNIGWGWGCFAFHAQEDGGIYAGVGAPGGGIRFAPGSGPEDIPPGTAVIGRWQRFIITYGHGVGAFYGDGHLIARKAMPAPQPHEDLYLGRAEAPENEPSSFAGDLGALLLYERMLDPQEIALLDRHLRGNLTP